MIYFGKHFHFNWLIKGSFLFSIFVGKCIYVDTSLETQVTTPSDHLEFA